jgi:splicing factor 3B subunit 3
LHIDYDTMAGGDKFGNVFITRMPADISLQVEDDPTGGKFAANGGSLNSAPHKVQPVINFHVGDLLMSMQLTAMQSGGREVRGQYSSFVGPLFRMRQAMNRTFCWLVP